MIAPKEISELVAKFRDNISEYKSQHYNETEVRREFIDPFFEALGWDVFNKAGYSEAYKDVKHEAAVKIKGETKNPDYAFRVGGKEKFFVEAKKPSVNITGDYNPAFQVRRYGWTAHLSLCVLTDFEEFAVYDTRVKPSINDAPSTARIMYFNFNDYESKWDEIASVFSKEAVLKGSFDKYADGNKKKKGTTEVDDDFLALMESWRESLAKNIALRNKSSQQFTGANAAKNLNEAVQKTIDRIVFLRICEDRGIEEPDQLRNVSEKNNVYGSLCDIFNLADAKYNSGLFHFQKESGREQDESWMLSLSIDDKVLKDIIKNLYYPAPYAFSVMPADILGHVYEKFLGKVIRLTAGNMAKVEEKPEVRKAGGVYYTPTYIVDYIVKNTVGELLKDKTPAEAEAIRILDPACGSGSFLIGAYQYLLDWYLNAYSSDSKKHATGKNPKIIAGEGGEFRLTTAEKKKILLNNIYGVDIDSQAVEVTKLSLLLKVLEGESSESLGAQFRYASERALPDLDANIKNGNSLIGTDYFDGKMGLDNGEEWERIKPFDWESEFPHVFAKKEAELKAYHVTWATHASRYSKKLGEVSGKDSGLNSPNMPSGIELSVLEREKIAGYILDKIQNEKYRVSDLNVMNDHVHMIICCEKDSLDKIIGEIKGYSARMFNKNDRGVNPSVDKPMYADGTIQKLWARSFGNVLITDEKQLDNTSDYIKTNHLKHNIAPIKINNDFLTNKKHLFEPVFSAGGFDAVIGNPPYVRIQTIQEFNPNFVQTLKEKFKSAQVGNYDIYVCFVEKAIELINEKGLTGYILPHKFFNSKYGVGLRQIISKKKNIKKIIYFGDLQIFNNATTYTCLFFLSKNKKENFKFIEVNNISNWVSNSSNFEEKIIETSNLISEEWNFKKQTDNKIFERITKQPNKLETISKNISQGFKTGADKIYIHNFKKEFLNDEHFIKVLKGQDIQRYNIKFNNRYSIFPYSNNCPTNEEELKNKSPNIYNYLLKERSDLNKRDRGIQKGKYWFSFSRNQFIGLAQEMKIITRDLANYPSFTFDESGEYGLMGGYGITIKNADKKHYYFVLGILNSKLTNYYITKISSTYRGGFYSYEKRFIRNIPIPDIKTTDSRHNTMVSLVETMLELNKKANREGITASERKMLEQQIAYTDKQIDKLVYELYELTEDEIKIVEGT